MHVTFSFLARATCLIECKKKLHYATGKRPFNQSSKKTITREFELDWFMFNMPISLCTYILH